MHTNRQRTTFQQAVTWSLSSPISANATLCRLLISSARDAIAPHQVRNCPRTVQFLGRLSPNPRLDTSTVPGNKSTARRYSAWRVCLLFVSVGASRLCLRTKGSTRPDGLAKLPSPWRPHIRRSEAMKNWCLPNVLVVTSSKNPSGNELLACDTRSIGLP